MSAKEDRWTIWHRADGSVVSCIEKIKVINENLDELATMAQDVFEDGLLLEIAEPQLREVLQQLINNLVNPYK